jgi:hypothetical protein
MEKNKKMIKIDLLDKFREMEDAADPVLPRMWLRKDYLAGLNSHERKVFDQALRELVSKGLVEYTPGVFPKVELTLKGEQLIHH